MKTLFTISIMLTNIFLSMAQKLNPIIAIQAGLVNTSKDENSTTRNGYSSNISFYYPLFAIKNTSFGVNASAVMNRLNNSFTVVNQIANQYQLRGETYPIEITNKENKTKINDLALGFESHIPFGRIYIAPSFQAGYYSNVLPEYSMQATLRDKIQEVKQISLQNRVKSKSSGVAFRPELKVGYHINSRIHIFTSAAYTFGNESVEQLNRLIPEGGYNDQNTYSTTQLLNGTYDNLTQKNKPKLLNFNLGIALNLGKVSKLSTFKKTATLTSLNELNAKSKKINLVANKSKTQVIQLEKGDYELSIKEPTKLEAQDFNTTRSNRDNRLKANPDTETSTDSVPTRKEAQDFNTTRSNRDNRLKANPNTKTSTDSVPTRQEAQDFNTTRSNRDNRLKANPDTKTSTDSVPTRQEAQDFNTTRSNRDNRLKADTIERNLVIKNLKNSAVLIIPINTNNVRFRIQEKGKYTFSIE